MERRPPKHGELFAVGGLAVFVVGYLALGVAVAVDAISLADFYAVCSLLAAALLVAFAMTMVVVKARGGHPLDRLARGPRRYPW